MEFGKQPYMGSGEQHPHHQQEQQQQRSRGAVQERLRAANVFSYSINAAAAVARGSVENKIEVEPARPHELNPTVFQEYYSSHLVPSLMETKPDPVLRFGGNPSPALRPVVTAGINGSFGVAEEPNANLASQIMSHPLYPRLVTAYMNCQKVGAPPELIVGLDEISKHYRNSHSIETSPGFTSDPELDQFMEEYCSLLQTYHEELTRPFTEAMTFFQRIELQLDSLSKVATVQSSHPGESEDVGDQNHVSSGEEDGSCGEIEYHDADPPAKEAKLKEKLLRKYGGYICTLKQEFMKRKKKGKLPKEARKKLLDWWYQHYKWPYPSEGEKAVLADSTGLDHKQINNWFINQRKRHWKPSDDMQYAMVGSPSMATHHHHHHHHPPPHTNMNPFGDTTSSRTQTGVLPTDRF